MHTLLGVQQSSVPTGSQHSQCFVSHNSGLLTRHESLRLLLLLKLFPEAQRIPAKTDRWQIREKPTYDLGNASDGRRASTVGMPFSHLQVTPHPRNRPGVRLFSGSASSTPMAKKRARELPKKKLSTSSPRAARLKCILQAGVCDLIALNSCCGFEVRNKP